MAPDHKPTALQIKVAALFKEWNGRGLPLERVAHLATLIADAATAARAEHEKPGRIGQTVRREAKRLLKMDREAMVAAFLCWDGLTEVEQTTRRYLDGAAHDAALDFVGLELTALDGWTALHPRLKPLPPVELRGCGVRQKTGRYPCWRSRLRAFSMN